MNRRLLLALAAATAAGLPAAAQEKRVVVYTAHIAAIIDKLAPRFERETGIKLEIVKAGSGDIIRRVRAEAGAPKADVIWSIGAEALEDNKDLLAAYTPKEDAAILKAYKVSPEWLPYTGILSVFAVNTKQLTPAQYPKSWADLADAKWKGKISSARTDSSGSAFMQLATVLLAHGDKGWALYEKILANIALSNSSGAVARFVNDGEAQIGIVLEDNALEFVKGGGNIAMVYPEDGTATIADGIAVIKGGPNPDNARVFIDWLLSKPVQTTLVEDIGRRPVRGDVAVKGLKAAAEIKFVTYDVAAVAKNRAAWIAQWKKLVQAR